MNFDEIRQAEIELDARLADGTADESDIIFTVERELRSHDIRPDGLSNKSEARYYDLPNGYTLRVASHGFVHACSNRDLFLFVGEGPESTEADYQIKPGANLNQIKAIINIILELSEKPEEE